MEFIINDPTVTTITYGINNTWGDPNVIVFDLNAHFEELNNRLFKRMVGRVGNFIEDTDMSKSEVEEIVLVGGSIRILKVGGCD